MDLRCYCNRPLTDDDLEEHGYRCKGCGEVVAPRKDFPTEEVMPPGSRRESAYNRMADEAGRAQYLEHLKEMRRHPFRVAPSALLLSAVPILGVLFLDWGVLGILASFGAGALAAILGCLARAALVAGNLAEEYRADAWKQLRSRAVGPLLLVGIGAVIIVAASGRLAGQSPEPFPTSVWLGMAIEVLIELCGVVLYAARRDYRRTRFHDATGQALVRGVTFYLPVAAGVLLVLPPLTLIVVVGVNLLAEQNPGWISAAQSPLRSSASGG